MKVPMSPEIAALLQNPRTARALMNAVLESRTPAGQQPITVKQGGKKTLYKAVTAVQRGSNT